MLWCAVPWRAVRNTTPGLPIAGTISEPGFLEGGDFFPMGQDLALVGVGLRSNVEACQQLLEQDLLGTRRLGVVRDDFDRHQVGGGRGERRGRGGAELPRDRDD